MTTTPTPGTPDAPPPQVAVGAPGGRPPWGGPPGEPVEQTGPWLQRTFRSLGNTEFRFLWTGSLLAMGAMQMMAFAQGFYVYELTGDPKLLGVVTAANGVPGLGLSLFGRGIRRPMGEAQHHPGQPAALCNPGALHRRPHLHRRHPLGTPDDCGLHPWLHHALHDAGKAGSGPADCPPAPHHERCRAQRAGHERDDDGGAGRRWARFRVGSAWQRCTSSSQQ